MATFDDVTRLFIDGLSQLTKYVPTVSSNYQHGDTQFRQCKESLTGHVGKFEGLGATIFAHTVENNIAISGRMQQKLGEFVLASDHTSRQVQTVNQQYNDRINNYLLPDGGIGLEYYNYSQFQVRDLLRDGVLSYADLDIVLTLGTKFLLDNLDQAKEGIWSDITYTSNQNC